MSKPKQRDLKKSSVATEVPRAAQCYTPQTLKCYQAGGLTPAQRILLEEHLLQCDSCLNLYLKLTDEYVGQLGTSDLSPDFVDRVMAMVQEEQSLAAEPKSQDSSGAKIQEKKNARLNLLIGYCAAACLAMFFWIGGWFDGITDIMKQETNTRKINLIQEGWTKKNFAEQPSLFANFKLEKE
ncbi:MAG: hypothetical protein GX207_07090 [Peptococcaceae bacterium]|nr:hypothetical protein [Peptococcaceae bacterium]